MWPRVEALRRHWAEALGATRASLYLLDTKPLPVVGYKRRKDRSDFAATADYGVCASRHLKYFGVDCSAPRRLACPLPGVVGIPASEPDNLTSSDTCRQVAHSSCSAVRPGIDIRTFTVAG